MSTTLGPILFFLAFYTAILLAIYLIMQPSPVHKGQRVYAKSIKWISARVDEPGEWESWIIRGLAGLSILMGIVAFLFGEPDSFWRELWPELVGIGVTVLGIDELNRRRQAKEFKRSIIRQMASQSNAFALDAARIAEVEGWLADGSLEGADLRRANLRGANLLLANLKGANFMSAQLEGSYLGNANLKGATLASNNLEGVSLVGANLKGAKLVDVHLEDANLWGANLEGASLLDVHLEGANLAETHLEGASLVETHLEGAYYDVHTTWPTDFDPAAAGALTWGEMSADDRAEWSEKYPPMNLRQLSALMDMDIVVQK